MKKGSDEFKEATRNNVNTGIGTFMYLTISIEIVSINPFDYFCRRLVIQRTYFSHNNVV